MSYMKLSVLSMFRYQGGKALVWAGGLIQFGACAGAIVMFILVNGVHLFRSNETC